MKPKIKTPEFFKDIVENGYHIFSLLKAKIPGFYPNEFPDYPGAKLSNLGVGDQITVRAFFKIGSGGEVRADGGYLDLEVELIAEDQLLGRIITKLPSQFALKTGSTLAIREDEILFKRELTVH